MPNYTQPDFRNPTPHPLVGVRAESIVNALVAGPLPLPIFIENLSDKDDPVRFYRGPKGQYRP